MRAVLNKIFLKKLGLGKFAVSAIAFLVGFTLALLALQGYVQIRSYLKPDRSRSNFIIVNKEVVMAHTLLGSHAQFAQEEISDLRQQSFVEDIAVFKSNNYEVVAHAGGEMGLYTELFFESVPMRFIDSPPSDFTWEEGAGFVPIIISQDFLDLYNFGFALGKGSRQLSRSTVQLVPLKVEITGAGGRMSFNAKVVGFSERIPSVLVPEEFLSWTNAHIGNPADEKISRVILKVRNNGSSALSAYLNDHNLMVSDEKMKFGKILSALDIFMVAVLAIGLGFVAFSLVIIMLNFSLIVSQASEEVSLLLQLGYSRKQLVFHLTGYLLVFMLVVISLSALAFMVGNHWLLNLLRGNGINISKDIAPQTGGMAIAFIVSFFMLSYFAIHRLIRRQ